MRGPLDVIVRIGGAGLCRTDLHIIEGQWEPKTAVRLPYIQGHENAGWVHAVGAAVTNVSVGDPVILHPHATCGLCGPCRRGDDVHCDSSAFPGVDTDGASPTSSVPTRVPSSNSPPAWRRKPSRPWPTPV